MKIPEFFKQWLESLTPQQAEEMVIYLDGDTNETLIDICAPIAISDPEIKARFYVK